PSGTPPLVGDVGGAFGASLRAWMQGRAIPGRGTQTPGRSPCFRTLRVSFHLIASWCRQAWVTDMKMQVGAGPPFPNPPLVGDVGGAFGASLRARTLRVSFHPFVVPAGMGG